LDGLGQENPTARRQKMEVPRRRSFASLRGKFHGRKFFARLPETRHSGASQYFLKNKNGLALFEQAL